MCRWSSSHSIAKVSKCSPDGRRLQPRTPLTTQSAHRFVRQRAAILMDRFGVQASGLSVGCFDQEIEVPCTRVPSSLKHVFPSVFLVPLENRAPLKSPPTTETTVRVPIDDFSPEKSIPQPRHFFPKETRLWRWECRRHDVTCGSERCSQFFSLSRLWTMLLFVGW